MLDVSCNSNEFFFLCLDSLCLFAVIFLYFNVCFGSCSWQLIVTGRFHPSARPKLISWCSRKLRLSSSSTSSSSLGFTRRPTVWTRPTSTRSPSGTPAASLVWSGLGFLQSPKCSLSFFLTEQNGLSVALNYQTEGRVLQLNRAKFYSNGNCGYLLKPASMCEGPTPFNPRKLFSVKNHPECVF